MPGITMSVTSACDRPVARARERERLLRRAALSTRVARAAQHQLDQRAHAVLVLAQQHRLVAAEPRPSAAGRSGSAAARPRGGGQQDT